MSYEAHLRAEIARIEAQNGIKIPEFKQPTSQPQVDIDQRIQQEIARQLSQLKPAMSEVKPEGDVMKTALFQLLKVSLKPIEMEWVNDHISKGSPGFAEFLNSDGVKTIAQMAFETYKEFLASGK